MASDLITVSEVRDHVETDLSDDALERLVDEGDGEIRRLFGPHDGERVENYLIPYARQFVTLKRPAESISRITERYDYDSIETVLDSDDYTLEDEGRTIRRRKQCWRQLVTVTYTPVAENPRRALALIDLVRLGVENDGVGQRRAGDYSETKLDYHNERSRVLMRLHQGYMGGA